MHNIFFSYSHSRILLYKSMYEATIELLYFYEKSRTARLELALRFAPPHLPQAPQQVDTYDKRGKLRFE